ncbi:MAG TPA: VWA domain-containing protein [Terracidiphilus sp.]|jgi:VWFA-related protein|nr:VWA domain-containing protein [Terracidiphilus sp.]
MTRLFFATPATKFCGRGLGVSGFAFAVALMSTVLPAQQTTTQPAHATQTPAAQPAAPQAGEQPVGSGVDVNAPTIKVGVNEVNLIFTVTDKHGKYIPNLRLGDFALLDDQKAPERVNSFHQQINLPLRVGILIDTSTSIHSRFKFEQQAATDFLLQILKARSDRAFVMGFDVTPTVTQNWTNDLDGLETGINRLSPGGGTALFDAVYTACRDKMLDESRGQEPVRKALILLSDGDDNQSRVYLSEAIKMCQRSETIIYAISTNWTPSRGQGDKVMSELAGDTGGQVFFPPSVEEVSTSFHNIEEELRSQYALTYTPADFKTDGAFRTIYLYCNDRRYQVRARKGYFAPRQ